MDHRDREDRREGRDARPITYRIGHRTGTIRTDNIRPAESTGEKKPAGGLKSDGWTSGPGWTRWLWKPIPGPEAIPAAVWGMLLSVWTLGLFVWLAVQLSA
jgi:hypothetical protein